MLRKLTGPGLFRLFLAMVVFVHHTTRLAFGVMAVYVFFCLSGFWIYKMYTGRYERTRHPYFTYLISRLWRLLPTFWLVSLFAVVFWYWNGKLQLAIHAGDAWHFIASNFFILGYDKLRMQPIAPAWSLDIELQFYIIAPLLAIVLARKILRPVWLLLLVAALSGVSAALHNKVHVLSCLVFFVIGMTAANREWKPSPKLVMWTAGVTLLICLACIASPWRGILLVGAHPVPLSRFNPPANILLALLTAPLALYTTGQKGFAFDDMCGDLSFVVYLLHWPLTEWFASMIPALGSYRGPFTVVLYFSVVAISIVVWKFYDKPINRMRGRWVNSRKKVALTAPEAQTVPTLG